MASPAPGGAGRWFVLVLRGTAAGEDAEGAIAAGVAARAPNDFGPEAGPPQAPCQLAVIEALDFALKRGLEGLAQVVQDLLGNGDEVFGMNDDLFVFHIVIIVYQHERLCQA